MISLEEYKKALGPLAQKLSEEDILGASMDTINLVVYKKRFIILI